MLPYAMAAIALLGAGAALFGAVELIRGSGIYVSRPWRYLFAAIWFVGWMWFPVGVLIGAYAYAPDAPSCHMRHLMGCFT